MYALDVTNNQEGFKKRRSNKVFESAKFAILMLLTVFSYAFICIIMGGELLCRPSQSQNLWESISTSSTALRELRRNFHSVSAPHHFDIVSCFNIHRCEWHNVDPVHRVIWAQQRCQSGLFEAAEAQRISSHFRSLRWVRCVSIGLGSVLANISNSQHHRCHNGANAGLFLLLLWIDGQVQDGKEATLIQSNKFVSQKLQE